MSRENRRKRSALSPAPRKKKQLRRSRSGADSVVRHGRHFGRTVYALGGISLLTDGFSHLRKSQGHPEVPIIYEANREHRAFETLLQMVPGLEEHVRNGSKEDIKNIAGRLQKGVASAKFADLKCLKGFILDWITPHGQPLNPPLAPDIKVDRGFHHECTGKLLCPVGLDWTNPEVKENLRSGETVVSGDQWPIFLYEGLKYDPKDPWKGLFRNSILVSAYKCIFISPSSVGNENKVVRNDKAQIHGMTEVTPASIAYIAVQARFALSASDSFGRGVDAAYSGPFYDSMLDLFEDVEEKEEVDDLIAWWNRQIFPSQRSSVRRSPPHDSVLAKIKERRTRRKAIANASAASSERHSKTMIL